MQDILDDYKRGLIDRTVTMLLLQAKGISFLEASNILTDIDLMLTDINYRVT